MICDNERADNITTITKEANNSDSRGGMDEHLLSSLALSSLHCLVYSTDDTVLITLCRAVGSLQVGPAVCRLIFNFD